MVEDGGNDRHRSIEGGEGDKGEQRSGRTLYVNLLTFIDARWLRIYLIYYASV
jgi:hypothetical protein